MRLVFGTIFIFIFQLIANGQGCSDAGFCTIPSFSQDESSDLPFSLELKGSLEGSEPGALIISPQIWFAYQATDKVQLSVKVPFWIVNDDQIGNVSSFSDPIVSATIALLSKENITINGTLGARIGIGNANLKDVNGLDLPMDYQNSLGTTDIIIGGSAQYSGFSFSLAAQIPIWHYNENQNVANRYLENPANTGMTEFTRKADFMARIDKTWLVKNWGFKAGILPIFHISDDEIKQGENMSTLSIDGSAGLTLNIPLGIWYNSGQWVFGLDAGFPVITRTERPDGLTRRYVIQPRIAYNF